MSASFVLIKNADNSISLGFGNGFTNGTTSSNSFTKLETSLVTWGGRYGVGAFTTPKSIDDLNIDLSAWAESLNDKSFHTLIDIKDNGLIPLSGFFLEKNLISQYEKIVAGDELPKKELVEPRLVHEYHPVYPTGRYFSTVRLITRFNDMIRLGYNTFPLTNEGLVEMESFFKSFCDTYKMKAIVDSAISEADYNSNISLVSTDGQDAGNRIEPMMKKYVDEANGILYLLCDANEKKVGYTVYINKGDYLLNLYGIKEWVSELPEVSITYDELMNYTLVAL